MPGFRRRSVSPEHAPDREGLPLARETFLLLRGPDRACEGTAGSGGPHSWHLAARVSRERIAPGRSSVRLTSRHRTSERTGLTRRRSRKSPDPKGGTPPCPVAGPSTDMCWPGRHAWNVVCADDFSHPRRRLRRPTSRSCPQGHSMAAADMPCRESVVSPTRGSPRPTGTGSGQPRHGGDTAVLWAPRVEPMAGDQRGLHVRFVPAVSRGSGCRR